MKIKNKEEFERVNMFGAGILNDMFAKYFIGNSFLNPLTKPGEGPIFMANVTFEPGCRNNWHGAKADSWFSHISVEVPGEDCSNEWLEEVSDEVYKGL